MNRIKDKIIEVVVEALEEGLDDDEIRDVVEAGITQWEWNVEDYDEAAEDASRDHWYDDDETQQFGALDD